MQDPRTPAQPPADRAVFPTSFGACGLAWRPSGLVRVLLPERDEATMKAKMNAVLGAEVSADAAAPTPAWVREAMAELTSYLAGVPVDLGVLRRDLCGVPPFFRRVYEVTQAVPRGEVRSYAAIAEAAGSRAASRAVGQAMARNPWPLVVPCHRVVAAGGKPGGFSAPGGLTTKARLLALERRAR